MSTATELAERFAARPEFQHSELEARGRRTYYQVAVPEGTKDHKINLTEWLIQRYFVMTAPMPPTAEQEAAAENFGNLAKAKAAMKRARRRFMRLAGFFIPQREFDRLADADGLGYIVPGFRI